MQSAVFRHFSLGTQPIRNKVSKKNAFAIVQFNFSNAIKYDWISKMIQNFKNPISIHEYFTIS